MFIIWRNSLSHVESKGNKPLSVKYKVLSLKFRSVITTLVVLTQDNVYKVVKEYKKR